MTIWQKIKVFVTKVAKSPQKKHCYHFVTIYYSLKVREPFRIGPVVFSRFINYREDLDKAIMIDEIRPIVREALAYSLVDSYNNSKKHKH